jgi:6-phosphogluconolactonase (cycloisomerase 2 family)
MPTLLTTLNTYAIDKVTGALTDVGDNPPTIAGWLGHLSIEPRGRFAYASDSSANNVAAFEIEPTTGALMPVAASPFQTGAIPGTPAFDPSGKFLYVLNSGSNDVSAYSIDPRTGALSAVPGSPFAADASADSVSVDVSGRFLYLTEVFSGPKVAYVIDAGTGALTLIAGSIFNPSPGPCCEVFSFDRNSNRAYGLSSCQRGYVPCEYEQNFGFFPYDLWTFAIDDQTGQLIQVGTPQPFVKIRDLQNVQALRFDPSGKFACSWIFSHYIENSISCYVIDATTGAFTGPFGSWSADVDNRIIPFQFIIE